MAGRRGSRILCLRRQSPELEAILRRGDVVYVNLPRPSLGAGSVQSGRRPAVVLNDSQQLPTIPVILLVPGTSKLTALRFPHTVQTNPTSSNGLHVPTVFLAFQLQAVDRRIIDPQPVGVLTDAELEAIENAVLEALGFGLPG